MAHHARAVGDHRERGVVPHAADRLLGVVDHGGKQQLHVLHRQPGRDLAAAQLVARIHCRRLGSVGTGQCGEVAEARDPLGIRLRAGDAVLDLTVAVEARSLARFAVEIDRDHLPRPKAAFQPDRGFGHHHHAGLRAGDQQIVGGQAVTHRPQRIAVHARQHPAPVGHRQRRRAVPGLHDAGEERVHRAMRIGQRVVLRPRLGDHHQLGGRRVAARADERLEHRIERRGIARARRNQRLDVLRMLAEGRCRHLDLVAAHPVLVAADRVDFAVMGEATERLREPPLRKGIGRIALVIDGKARHEARIREVGIEHRQFLGKEQPLVNDAARRQRADVKALNLGLDDAFLDPPADQEQVLFERVARAVRRVRPGDHDLLDLGPRLHRLVTDHRNIDRHLPPAIDGVAKADDLRFDDGAAGLLRRQIGARQEDLPDCQPVRLGPVAGAVDMFVEEIERQLDMNAGPVAGLAVGIDRAAMPDRLQRVDRRGDDTTRRLAVGRRDQPDAARV